MVENDLFWTTICRVAKAKTFVAKSIKKKIGRPKMNENSAVSLPIISAFSSATSSVSRPIPLSTPTTITICRVCCVEIYRGCRHTCITSRSSRKRKIDNISNLLSSPDTSKKLSERVAPKCNASEKQNLFGISTEDASTIGKNMNLSARKTKELCHYLRAATNSRKAVGPNVEAQLY